MRAGAKHGPLISAARPRGDTLNTTESKSPRSPIASAQASVNPRTSSAASQPSAPEASARQAAIFLILGKYSGQLFRDTSNTIPAAESFHMDNLPGSNPRRVLRGGLVVYHPSAAMSIVQRSIRGNLRQSVGSTPRMLRNCWHSIAPSRQQSGYAEPRTHWLGFHSHSC